MPRVQAADKSPRQATVECNEWVLNGHLLEPGQFYLVSCATQNLVNKFGRRKLRVFGSQTKVYKVNALSPSDSLTMIVQLCPGISVEMV